MKRLIMFAFLPAALLTACDGREDGGLTREESRQLNEAAEMLDASPDGLVAEEDVALGNGDEPIVEPGDAVVAGEATVADEDGGAIVNDGSMPPPQ